MTENVDAQNKALVIGELVPDQGIYLGQYIQQSKEGSLFKRKTIRKVFNIFAAPEDLPIGSKEYARALEHLRTMKEWHGFTGEAYDDNDAFMKALKAGTYKGGWTIPSREFLLGTLEKKRVNPDEDEIIQPDNFFDHNDRGALKGAFSFNSAYWSCTAKSKGSERRWKASPMKGRGEWSGSYDREAYCRPIRLVPVCSATV